VNKIADQQRHLRSSTQPRTPAPTARFRRTSGTYLSFGTCTACESGGVPGEVFAAFARRLRAGHPGAAHARDASGEAARQAATPRRSACLSRSALAASSTHPTAVYVPSPVAAAQGIQLERPLTENCAPVGARNNRPACAREGEAGHAVMSKQQCRRFQRRGSLAARGLICHPKAAPRFAGGEHFVLWGRCDHRRSVEAGRFRSRGAVCFRAGGDARSEDDQQHPGSTGLHAHETQHDLERFAEVGR
jgi:hypothetical protein